MSGGDRRIAVEWRRSNWLTMLSYPFSASLKWKSLMEAAPQINKLVDGKQAELERRDENVQATVQERETEKTNHKLGRHTSDQSAS